MYYCPYFLSSENFSIINPATTERPSATSKLNVRHAACVDIQSALTSIRELVEEPDQKFILVYDFLKLWIFLIECIELQEETPNLPTLLLSVGEKPNEDSKELDEEFQMPAEEEEQEEEDKFGFDDFEDGFSEEDLSPYI